MTAALRFAQLVGLGCNILLVFLATKGLSGDLISYNIIILICATIGIVLTVASLTKSTNHRDKS